MTKIRLAHIPQAQGDNCFLGIRGVEKLPESSRPSLLVSYWYSKYFLPKKDDYAIRDWVLDSGAFSAFNQGTPIDLVEYIDCCLEHQSDPRLAEIFALDVIGDHEQSLKNTERMWDEGVRAIPCFHAGEPWELLDHLSKTYPKIAIGGIVGRIASPENKFQFISQCFARVWPKSIHGFGTCAPQLLEAFPFDSVDASNWELGPCKFGRWRSFGGVRPGRTGWRIGTTPRRGLRRRGRRRLTGEKPPEGVSWYGSDQNLRAEIEYYLDLERYLARKWKKQLAQVNGL